MFISVSAMMMYNSEYGRRLQDKTRDRRKPRTLAGVLAQVVRMDEVKPRTKVLKNGAIYDMDKGRIVANPGGGKYAITSETASEFHAKRQERKREAIIRGANAVAAEGGKYDGTDLDFIEAIAEVQTIKALNPDDPKSTDAARFILQESGLAEAKQVQATPAEAVTDILREVASIAASLAHGFDNYNYRKHEEGQVVDADTGQAEEAGG